MNLKELASIIKGTVLGPITETYNLGDWFGEFGADSMIAYDFYKQMKATNKKLIDT